jgi:DNA-binding IclR family transcriptional regulator
MAEKASGTGADGGVRSVQRALELLAHFDDAHVVWTVSELARATRLPKTTVVRLVATLEGAGMVWVRPDGQVVPGAGLLRWARLGKAAWELPEAVQQVMRDVARLCAETVSLYVRQGPVRVCVAQQQGPHTLRHVVTPGDELPLWGGAASKVLLTDASPDVLDEVAARSPGGAAFIAELREQVDDARKAGYAVSHGERETGSSGVAAPIVDGEGRIIAALALGGPTGRFTPGQVARFVAVVTASADEISDLGLARAFPQP